MKAQSLVGRLALLQLGAAGALLLAFAVPTIVLTQRTLEAWEASELSRTAADVAGALQGEWSEHHDLARAARATLREDAPSGFRVEILDDGGRLIFRAPDNASPRPAGEYRSVRRHVPIGAWVVVTVSTRPQRTAVRALAITLILVGVPLFGVTALLSRTVASKMLWPLRRMAVQSRRASEKGVISPLGTPRDPLELQHLARAFNQLLQRLDLTLEGERRFTQDAAHELRTPLTVISGEIEYALGHLPPGDPSRPGLERAAQQAQAMSGLVDALLFLRRAESDTVSGEESDVPVNLSDLTREAMDALVDQEPRRRSDIVLETDEEVLVAGNGVLVAAAVRNLVANAFKFTAEGTPVRLSSRTRDGLGQVVVEDGGGGVQPENRERVFDPYFREAEARANRSGFGIGLALARRIIRAHGGDVVLGRSDLGGARFELTLPGWNRPATAR